MYNKVLEYTNSVIAKFNKIATFQEHLWTKKVAFIIIIVLSFALISILNWLQPLFGDDWNYSLGIDGHTRIKNFTDIFDSLYKHYFDWGGRMVVHFIAEILLMFNTHIADIINSLAYIGLTLVIYKIANLNNTIRPSLLLGINFLIWFLQPAFASTILWITGSANYLWGTLIILIFIIPYISQIYTPKDNGSIGRSILLFIGGIIAGWTNENTVVALIFMLILIILYYKIKQNKIPIWAISGFFGILLGAVLMIAAPGNYARMDSEITTRYTNLSCINLFVNRFTNTIFTYYYHVLTPTFIYIFTLCIYSTYRIKNEKPILFVSGIFFTASIVATMAMMASPIFPGRATFGIIIFMIVAIGILYANLDFSKTLVRRISYTVLIFAFLIFISDYSRGFKMLTKIDKHLISRITSIEKEKKKGQKDFILEDRITDYDNRLLHYYELTPDSTDWHNRMFSKYHEINTIIIR